MHVDPLSAGKFHAAFFDATEFVDTYTRQIMQGTLFLPGEEGFPAKGAACAAILMFPVNNDRVELQATVERISENPPKGAHLKLAPLPPEVKSGIEAFLTEVLRGESPPVRFLGTSDKDMSDINKALLEDDPEKDQAILQQQQDGGAAHKSRGVYAQVQEMAIPQKIKLALTGGKAARAVLMKEAQPVVHQYVLKNPRITNDEITEIARNPGSGTEVIRLISVNQQWMGDPTIRWNIIRNPKTNTQLVLSLLPKLQVSQLSQLAKSDSVKGAISQAAHKILEARGKRG
ncbi:MAG: hypothetical protein AB1405_12435 [Bdellovibrionota bacterium]